MNLITGDRQVRELTAAELLRRLRVNAKLTQDQMAEGIPTLDGAAVSEWEHGKHLRRFLIHVPQLLEKIGPQVLNLMQPVMAALGDSEEEVAHAMIALLNENGELPTLDALATRLGYDLPLDIEEGVGLLRQVLVTGVRYGWTMTRLPEKEGVGG